jgi:hypothetical protein
MAVLEMDVVTAGVHLDDFPHVYYSIKFVDGREKDRWRSTG